MVLLEKLDHRLGWQVKVNSAFVTWPTWPGDANQHGWKGHKTGSRSDWPFIRHFIIQVDLMLIWLSLIGFGLYWNEIFNHVSIKMFQVFFVCFIFLWKRATVLIFPNIQVGYLCVNIRRRVRLNYRIQQQQQKMKNLKKYWKKMSWKVVSGYLINLLILFIFFVVF